ncbi:MAG: hypothetical protein P1U88_04870 [Thalassobaculaceae bacterium]|nr:hypothetical protein [Thalassobaculaceae bacterium]
MLFVRPLAVSIILSAGIVLTGCDGPQPGEVLDEAMIACLASEPVQALPKDQGERYCRSGQQLPGSDSDFLKDMDRGWGPAKVHAELANSLQLEPGLLVENGLTEEVVYDSYNRGRNNWVIWSGGNDRLWDYMANNTFGAFDLLKTLSSHPGIRYCANKNDEGGDDNTVQSPPGYYAYEDDACEGADREFREVSRDNRWKYLGLVNEPGFKKWEPKAGCETDPEPVDGADPNQWCGNKDRWGLWLDARDGLADPFESEVDYPGVKIGARGETDIHGETFPVGSYYGYGTGIVGLRLFPNPDFDKDAQEAWDPWRYYNDPDYYKQKDLVRPYRVGMSCGFCHVGPSPVAAPADPENPQWTNLTSNPGAQYFWIDRIFFWDPEGRHRNFIYQLFHTSLPGSLDTSLVSSDNINNPRTMNAVYSVAARLDMAKHARELLTGGELNNKQFNDYQRTALLGDLFEAPYVKTPHVLKDGADSVGVLGALNRVYLNIGLASEEWLLHFKPLIGNLPGKRITPIEISVLEKISGYWNANVAQTPDVGLFFLASAQPDRLEDFAVGRRLLEEEGFKALAAAGTFETHGAMLERGKVVFAETCARCHSGKQPVLWNPGEGPATDPTAIAMDSPAYYDWMRRVVAEPDFLEHNFLSTEVRIPVTELDTNACSPLATNGLRGDIWDNFTSTTYKELPAVGKVTVHHPKTGEPWAYEMPGGGRGYTRPASLVSLWSTAPFLLNNSVGDFYGSASPQARMASFNDSIRRMLWPDLRRKDSLLGDKVPGYIQRTTSISSLQVPFGYLPDHLETLLSGPLERWLPWLVGDGQVEVGPIPEGTAVGLLANLPLVSDSTALRDKIDHQLELLKLLPTVIKDLKSIPKDLSDAEKNERAREVFANLVDPLIKLSKCPDYVVNRGHYFGSNLDDPDKYALIEFLRTF